MREVGGHRDEPERLVGVLPQRRVGARVVERQVAEDMDAARAEVLGQPCAQRVTRAPALVREHLAGHPENAEPSEQRRVLELLVVDGRHQLVQLLAAVAGGHEAADDRTGRRATHLVDRVTVLQQDGDRACERDPLDAPALEHEICVQSVGHGEAPLAGGSTPFRGGRRQADTAVGGCRGVVLVRATSSRRTTSVAVHCPAGRGSAQRPRPDLARPVDPSAPPGPAPRVGES